MNPAKTLGGIPKRKFTPKPPKKTNDTPVPSHESSEAASVRTVPVKQEKFRKNNSRSRDGNSGRGRGRGEGRGRFVMPTGQAFFTGGGASASSSSQANRFNTTIGEGGSNSKASDDANQSSAHRRSPTTDFEDDGRVVKTEDGFAEAEDISPVAWPPTDYSETDPVVLPLGPPTMRGRQQETEKPPFAAADDPEGLEAEEREAVYLLQFPSVLESMYQAAKNDDNEAGSEHVKHDINSHTVNKSTLKLPKGKIGKIRIRKSGKIELVIEAIKRDTYRGRQRSGSVGGRERSFSMDSHHEEEKHQVDMHYEISPGISSSFQQLIASISPTDSTIADPLAENTTSNASPCENDDHSLHIMASVTKKIVVTPDLDYESSASVAGVRIMTE